MQNPFKLIVKQGPSPAQEFELTQAEIVLGRDPGLDLVFNLTAVSRRHARLTLRGDSYFLEDLGSSNGTFLNGELVTVATPLNPGDQISLGHAVTLLFTGPMVTAPETQIAQSPLVQTVIEDDSSLKTAIGSPQLRIEVSGLASQTIPLTKSVISLGRNTDNDIVIPSNIVSRYHARLEKTGEAYQLTVLPQATNQLLLNGKVVTGPSSLQPGDQIQVSSNIPDMHVTLVYLVPGVSVSTPEALVQTATRVSQGSLQQSDQTMMDAGFDYEQPSIPPQFVVTVAGESSQTYTLVGESYTLGRAEDNQIIIPSQIVSRHHARLEQAGSGYQLVVLPDVINTLVCRGKPVTGRYQLRDSDVLRIDSTIPGMMVTMEYRSPSEASREFHTIRFEDKEVLTFGRDPSNDVCLNVPTVSRFHSQIERVGQRYRVQDLQSSNGTFVNDERITGEVWLHPQDTIRIGPYRYVMGEDQFIQYDETSGLKVEAVGLNKWVRKNLNILENISLIFQPREFIVVVGQSGGGKSTLVDAVAGYRPATHGRVLVNGIDVYRNFDAIRNEIGYVPQRDIIHMELTVYQALDYAARLRMPRDTTREERHQRITEVLEDLDLVHRKDVQISGLSGGQQKRVSIGVELLTRPGLFFLDEPTSGLDPGTETAFMHLMRRLADQGRTIIMVTHATKNVMLADKVVFLARGGYLAWFGPPDEALKYFDQYRTDRERLSREMEFDQIYAILDDPSKGDAQEWAQRFQEHQAFQQYIAEPLQTKPESLPLVSAASAPPAERAAQVQPRQRSRASALHQFFVLSARNLKILTRDRSSLMLMLLAAPLVGSLDFIIAPLMGKAPFDYFTGDAANGSITLFLLTINCLLVGGLSQMREFVKEADIYRRERLVNLKILPYVTSKLWVAALLAFYHSLAYAIIRYLAFDMPGGSLEFMLIYISLVLAVLAGMVGGLLVSAFAKNASSAPLLLILMIVPQIVLSGALAPVPDYASAIASTRWAFESMIGIVGVGSDISADACWQLPDELRDGMSIDDKTANQCRCMGLAVFDPASCNFPGIGEYYEPEIDQQAPVEPPPLGERPPEPVIPPGPEPPQDQFDQVAVAQYLNALQAYQDDVNLIQTDYKNQMELFESQAKVYQAEMVKYQEALSEYELKRNGAVKGAEGLIESVRNEFGWAWVNKNNPDEFWPWMIKAWSAQLIIVLVYFLIILFLIKRKDVR